MKNKLYLFAFLLQVLALSVHAARVDTVFVKSPSMNREVKVVYILPDKAVAGNPQACPVIYLLHGYGGTRVRGLASNRSCLGLLMKKA